MLGGFWQNKVKAPFRGPLLAGFSNIIDFIDVFYVLVTFLVTSKPLLFLVRSISSWVGLEVMEREIEEGGYFEPPSIILTT